MPTSRGQANLWEFVQLEGDSRSTAGPILVAPRTRDSYNTAVGFDYAAVVNNVPDFVAGDALGIDAAVRGARNVVPSPRISSVGASDNNSENKRPPGQPPTPAADAAPPR